MRCLNVYILLLFIFSCESKDNDHFVSLESKKITQRWVGDELVELKLPFVIEKGYHLQLPNPSNPLFIPTEISMNRSKAVNIVKVEFDFATNPEKPKQFEGIYQSFDVVIQLNILDQDNLNTIGGTLTYQTCDEAKCFFPRSLYFKIDLSDI